MLTPRKSEVTKKAGERQRHLFELFVKLKFDRRRLHCFPVPALYEEVDYI